MSNAGEDVRRDIRECLRRGDVAGAIRGYLQLIDEHPDDWTSVNALGDLYLRQGDIDNAVAQFLKVADYYSAEGFLPRAAALYRKILKNKYDDLAMLSLIDVVARQGQLGEAKEYLIELERTRRASGDVSGADETLESLERLAETQGALPTLTVLDESSLEIAPPEADPTDEDLAALIGVDASAIGALSIETVAIDGDVEGEPDEVRSVGDAAREGVEAHGIVGGENSAESAMSIQSDAMPTEMAMRNAVLRDPSADFAVNDPGLAAGQDTLAVDLASTVDPGVSDAGLELAPPAAAPASPFDLDDPPPVAPSDDLSLDDLPGELHAHGIGQPTSHQPSSTSLSIDDLGLPADAGPSPPPAPARSPLLARRKKPMPGRKMPAAAKRAKPLQSIFDQMREAAEKEQDTAHERFDLAQYHLRDGREDEAMAQLQLAAQSPVVRFKASAQLGRLYLWRGDLGAAIEWLERAAEVPPVSPDEGHAVLYELADALEQQGEPVRSLAVLIELEAQRRAYRDVPRRIARLSAKPEQGSGDQ